MRTALVALLLVLTALPMAWAQEVEQPPPAPAAESPAAATDNDFMALLTSATEDQRARVLRFIRNRYPDLSVELFALIQARHPGAFLALDRELQNLIATKYPRLAATVQSLLQDAIAQRYPQVREEINQLIIDKYPEVLAAMYQGEGDPAVSAARVVRERYRALLDDVLAMLRERHPTLLIEVQRELLIKHPELLADAADLIVRLHPDIAREVGGLLVAKYPELMPGILEILQPPPVEEPTELPMDE